MPQQLIYTSAQRGVVAGRSGYCTVARSAAMRDALMLQLEKLSYYQHLSLSGGQERRISACRFFEIRGTGYHVLSRIQDAGLDFTGRTNFLAHHLVFTPEEIRQHPSPPLILRSWNGWLNKWTQDPAYLENEDWGNLAQLKSAVSVPAQTWQSVTGDAANGYGLLELRAGASLRVDNLSDDQILTLFAESLELLELRDPRKDFQASAWKYTFTTAMQEQDNPADFRWRCLYADNPAAARFAGPDCRALSEVRVQRCSNEEKTFAQLGRQPPRFVTQPQNLRASEGQPVRLVAKAEGIPAPSYQWFAVDKNGASQPVPSGNGPELVLTNPPFGVSRYLVQVTNSLGQATSDVVKVECEKKPTGPPSTTETVLRVKPKDPASYVRSAEAIDRQRARLASEEAQRQAESNKGWSHLLLIWGMVFFVAILLGASIVFWFWHKHNPATMSQGVSSNVLASADSLATNRGDPAVANVRALNTNTAMMPVQGGASVSAHSNQVDAPQEFKLPEGWESIPVGTVTNMHRDFFAEPPSGFKAPRLDLTAAAAGIAEPGDDLWFVCKTCASNQVSANLYVDETLPVGSVCGLMVRDSKEPHASFQFIGYSPSRIVVYSRNSAGIFHVDKFPLPSLPARTQLHFRIQRVNTNVISQYYLYNLWRPLGATNIFWPSETMLGGMAVASGSLSNKVTAKFDAVEVN